MPQVLLEDNFDELIDIVDLLDSTSANPKKSRAGRWAHSEILQFASIPLEGVSPGPSTLRGTARENFVLSEKQFTPNSSLKFKSTVSKGSPFKHFLSGEPPPRKKEQKEQDRDRAETLDSDTVLLSAQALEKMELPDCRDC